MIHISWLSIPRKEVSVFIISNINISNLLVPVKPPQYSSHTVISSTSVTVHWTPPTIEDSRGFITEYTLHVHSVDGTQFYNVSGNMTNVTISGISPEKHN